MDNRYYVKIRLYEDLPVMPHSGKYLEFMIEATSEQDIRMKYCECILDMIGENHNHLLQGLARAPRASPMLRLPLHRR